MGWGVNAVVSLLSSCHSVSPGLFGLEWGLMKVESMERRLWWEVWWVDSEEEKSSEKREDCGRKERWGGGARKRGLDSSDVVGSWAVKLGLRDEFWGVEISCIDSEISGAVTKDCWDIFVRSKGGTWG